MLSQNENINMRQSNILMMQGMPLSAYTLLEDQKRTQGNRLTGREAESAYKAAREEMNSKLTTEVVNGQPQKRLYLTTAEGDTIIIRKKFIDEVYACNYKKNFKHREIARVLDTSVNIDLWIGTAIRKSRQRSDHHSVPFRIYEAVFGTKKVVLQAMETKDGKASFAHNIIT